jgi:hypothetical protein
MSYFNVIFCGHTKHVSRVKLCSAYTTLTYGHGIILMLSANTGTKSTSASAFVGNIVVGPYLLRERLTAQRYRGFLETVLLSMGRGCIFIMAELQHRMWKCLAVVERNLFRKVDFTSRTDFMATSVI